MRVRVVCGLSLITAIFCPMRLLMSVDLPTFGRPTTAMKPDLCFAFSIVLPFRCHLLRASCRAFRRSLTRHAESRHHMALLLLHLLPLRLFYMVVA